MAIDDARHERDAQHAWPRWIVMVAAAGASLWGPGSAAQTALPLDRIKLPQGFVIETVARVPNAREMAWGSEGTLFVGSGSAGNVYAVTLPRAGAQDAARVRTIASSLRDPAGVAFRNGALYVSAVSRILRYDEIEKRLAEPAATTTRARPRTVEKP